MSATLLMLVNEGTSHFVTVSFRDENGSAVVPSSIAVRIDDDTGAPVRAPGAVTPASSIEVEITPEENRILDARHSKEGRIVTVVAAYGAGGAKGVTGEYRYAVRNLKFVAPPA